MQIAIDKWQPMASKKVIAICQSGGEFVTSADGSLAYQGGEAYATDIDLDTKLADLKSEVADMFGKTHPMFIKYLLPSNKKTLITIAKDKDLQRMINYLRDAATVDLFIIYEEAPPPPPPPQDKALVPTRYFFPPSFNNIQSCTSLLSLFYSIGKLENVPLFRLHYCHTVLSSKCMTAGYTRIVYIACRL